MSTDRTIQPNVCFALFVEPCDNRPRSGHSPPTQPKEPTMALQDPVVVYDAATNVEAQMLKLLLIEAGIEAFVAEDLSTGGIWMFGLLPGIHKPQVWVSQSDVRAAQSVLEGYERLAAERERDGTNRLGGLFADQSLVRRVWPDQFVPVRRARPRSRLPTLWCLRRRGRNRRELSRSGTGA